MNLSVQELLAECGEDERLAPEATVPAEAAGRTARYELKYLVPEDCCTDLKRDLLRFLVHEPLDRGEAFTSRTAEVGQVEHGVSGEDPVETVPVAVVDCVAVPARQLMKLD